MPNARPLPNIPLCAIGFAAAGCGVGSLLGMALGPWLYPPLHDGVGTMHEQAMTAYGGTLHGMWVGAVLGAVAGVVYAVGRRGRAGG